MKVWFSLGLATSLMMLLACESAPAPSAKPQAAAAAPAQIGAKGSPAGVGNIGGVWAGIFQEKTPNDPQVLKDLETVIGRKFAVQMWFIDFNADFPTADVEKAWDSQTFPNITWEPWLWNDKDKIHLDDIVTGRWDDYISKWGRDAAAWGKPVFVRWGHEFNGDWYPWSVSKNGEDAKLYVKAFRRVHDLVTKAGAKNILWVWCPNQASFPPQNWNNPLLAYPGDDVVDWVALDGYDFDGKETFDSLFGRIYSEMVAGTSKPIYIGETSTGRKGAQKAVWIQEMNKDLTTKFPGIKGLVWFDINKERDWRLEESEAALKGAASVFSLPLYRSEPDSITALASDYSRDLTAIRARANADFAVPKNVLTAFHLTAGAGGQLDWTSVPGLSVQGSAGPQGEVKVAWDDQALYLHLEAKVGRPMLNLKSNDEIWNGDNLEFCLSTNPKADPHRGYFAASDWQLGFSPGDGSMNHPVRTWEWSKLKSQVPGAKVTANAVSGGWVLDASVPWSSLGGFQVKAGMSLGFDTAVDLAGADGSRVSQWVWNGNSQFYNNPVQWGVLVLGQ